MSGHCAAAVQLSWKSASAGNKGTMYRAYFQSLGPPTIPRSPVRIGSYDTTIGLIGHLTNASLRRQTTLLVGEGMRTDETRAAALRDFGNVLQAYAKPR